MRGLLCVLVSFCVLCVAYGEAKAADRITFVPTTDWTNIQNEGSCAISREFSDGRSEATLVLRRYSPGTGFRIQISGSRIGAFRKANETKVSFGPGGRQEIDSLFSRSRIDGDWRFTISDVSLFAPEDFSESSGDDLTQALRRRGRSPQQEIAMADTVSSLSFDNGFSRSFTFETGSFARPIEMLQSCMDGVIASWGFDPAVQRNLSERAFPSDYAQLVNSFNFPLNMWMRWRGGTVRIRIMIDAEGTPTDCVLTGPRVEQPLIDETCRALMTETTYDPALDADGVPVASFYTPSVVFPTRR
jgi:hypothetical protein